MVDPDLLQKLQWRHKLDLRYARAEGMLLGVVLTSPKRMSASSRTCAPAFPICARGLPKANRRPA